MILVEISVKGEIPLIYVALIYVGIETRPDLEQMLAHNRKPWKSPNQAHKQHRINIWGLVAFMCSMCLCRVRKCFCFAIDSSSQNNFTSSLLLYTRNNKNILWEYFRDWKYSKFITFKRYWQYINTTYYTLSVKKKTAKSE